jgi:hypothetical protein
VSGFRGAAHPYHHDPSVRLGLLASLQHQLRADLLDTAYHARELGYTPDELLTLLTIKPPSR